MDRSVYTRPNKPRYQPVRKRQADTRPALDIKTPIYVDSSTECHVTPAAIAQRMMDYLEGRPEHSYLEPSAGTGELIQALLDEMPDLSRVQAVERHVTLNRYLQERFNGRPQVSICNQCFLSYAEKLLPKERFDRILMNPPFREAKKHIKAAVSLLAPVDGILVALVPITFDMEGFSTLRMLSCDTFALAKVRTKIVRYLTSSK